jgi:Raf kinase inhibitor-like YbhB/YbcL family protein
MKLTSTDFDDGGALDARFGRKFDDLSPQLAWADVPAGAASLALTVVDPHPVARGYVHWFVESIPPVDGAFATGAGGRIPVGRELKPYTGPNPPSGTHDYVFTLYALDAEVRASPAKTSVDAFLEKAAGHVLATASLTGSFTKGGVAS